MLSNNYIVPTALIAVLAVPTALIATALIATALAFPGVSCVTGLAHPKRTQGDLDQILEQFEEREFLEDVRDYILPDAVECDVISTTGPTHAIIFEDEGYSLSLEGNAMCVGETGGVAIPVKVVVYFSPGDDAYVTWALTGPPLARLK